jgi:predicted RNA binding protein YcfA (HicA-like mRNA interferase family)
MKGLHNLKPEKVVKAFERAGWEVKRQTGSHVILAKEHNPLILSVPVHKGKPLKHGLLCKLIEISGLTEDEFLLYYK